MIKMGWVWLWGPIFYLESVWESFCLCYFINFSYLPAEFYVSQVLYQLFTHNTKKISTVLILNKTDLVK